MVDLTGEFYAEEAQEVINDIHIGIEAGKKIVISTHDFETKLLATDMLFMHLQMEYSEYDELHDFFVEVSEKLVELRDELEELRKGEIHFVISLEAAEKVGRKWSLHHLKKVKGSLKGVSDVSRDAIFRIDKTFEEIKILFNQSDHLFEVSIEEATVGSVKMELEEKEKEVRHILERLLRFILAYEKLFKEALGKVKK